MEGAAQRTGLRAATVEIGVAILFLAIGGVAIWDSLRIGAGWSADGPRSGYFPFWVGLLLVGASLVNLLRAVHGFKARGGPVFLTREEARPVLSVLIPATLYCAAIPSLGLYVPSILLVAWFMMVLGGFSWRVALPSAVAVALVVFVTFETWFLVALPKGPVETWLGYN
jgi:hypothetical protein